MEYIIDNWTDIHIEIIIYQNDNFRYIAENISKIKETCNRKNIPVFDDKILSVTKIFNDAVFEKYGFLYLMKGIHNLIAFECKASYILVESKTIKKNCLKEKNRLLILQELEKN